MIWSLGKLEVNTGGMDPQAVFVLGALGRSELSSILMDSPSTAKRMQIVTQHAIRLSKRDQLSHKHYL